MLKKISTLVCIFCITMPILAANESHDPTKPFGYIAQETTESNIKIDAILGDKNNRVVIIGGQRFKVGDVVMGATITAIDAQAIKLKDNSGEYAVGLSNVKVKTPSPITKKPLRN